MPHLNPDRLIEVGLTADTTDAEHTHLTECAHCRSEVASIGHVTDLVRAAGKLPAAAPRVHGRPRRNDGPPPAHPSSSRVA